MERQIDGSELGKWLAKLTIAFNKQFDIKYIIKSLSAAGLFRNEVDTPECRIYLVDISKDSEGNNTCRIKVSLNNTVTCRSETLIDEIKKLSKMKECFTKKIFEENEEHCVFACAYDNLFDSEITNEIFLGFLSYIYTIHVTGRSLDVSIELFREYVNNFFYERHHFYLNTMDYIACLPYEGRPCYGKICFPKKYDEKLNISDKYFWKLSHQGKGYLNHYSAANIRKLLELSVADNLCLCANPLYVSGISNRFDSFPVIKFKGFGQWEWHIGQTLVLSSIGGSYVLPPKTDIQKKARDEIGQVFPEIDKKLLDYIISQEFDHGALFILSDTEGIESITKTLADFKRCFPISMPLLTTLSKGDVKDIIKSLSNIDGAIFIDTEGKIHAIGAILDGEAKVKADPSRGSRYNSAQNYIANMNSESSKYVAIIISSDKMIDLSFSNNAIGKIKQESIKS